MPVSAPRFLLLCAVIAASALLQGCDARPETRDERTDRYIEDVFQALLLGQDAQKQMTAANTNKEKAAAARHFATAARDIASTVYKLDANDIYPEAIDLGRAVAEWGDKEGVETMKTAQHFEDLAAGKKMDFVAAIAQGAEAAARSKELGNRAREVERLLRDKYGFENANLTSFVKQFDQKSR